MATERWVRAAGVTSERSGDQVVVLDAEGQTMITLNPTGSLLWDHLSSAVTLDDLRGKLVSLFPDVDQEVLDRDLAAFLEEMVQASLVSEVP